MLPSPRCPKGRGRAPGTRLVTAAVASATKAGTDATGTETSCLIEPPSWRCTSPNSSRMRQNILACSRLSAMVASATSPRSRPSARISSSTARKPERACEESSISTYQGCAAGSAVLEHELDAHAQHQLEAGHAARRALGRDPEQRERGLGRGHPDEGGL